MANLHWLGRTLISDHTDINVSYLLDKDSLFSSNSAKSLNIAIPGGPKSEPLYCDMHNLDVD